MLLFCNKAVVSSLTRAFEKDEFSLLVAYTWPVWVETVAGFGFGRIVPCVWGWTAFVA